MKLTVVSVAYPASPVSLGTSGGAEQILALLDRALVRAGHRSIVIAAEGSEVEGALIETPLPDGDFNEDALHRARERHRHAIERALVRWPVDLVHLHGQDFNHYLPPVGVPALVTLHCPPQWYAPEVFSLSRPATYLQCVSKSQRDTLPPETNLLSEIPNGVPLDLLATRVRKREFALCLGRICPEKGFDLAVDAAIRAGITLVIAGHLFPYEEHERYWRKLLAPKLDQRRRWVGPVGMARKRRLLSAAKCLLTPSRVAETSSLVAMEALACGTPVIAFPAGALPEIVDHGKTGFVVNSVAEMAGAIGCLDSIDAKTCRETAEQRFSAATMCSAYLGRYEELVRKAVSVTS